MASVIPNPESSLEKLISLADVALYKAKIGGRDRVALNPGFLGTNDIELGSTYSIVNCQGSTVG